VRAKRDIRPTIVLTGFGPFPGVPENVSSQLAQTLAERAARRLPKKHIVSHVIPTEWAAAPQHLASLYNLHDPILVLHFGVSSRASGFCIETSARNIQGEFHDAAGHLPDNKMISSNGPLALSASLPAAEICARLKRLNVPTRLSNDAGSYLCNHVLYRSLQWADRSKKPAMAGFIHLPVALARPFDFETALMGGMEIIRSCLGLPELKVPDGERLAVNKR
jgi:pyroglutamyl-peptidase